MEELGPGVALGRFIGGGEIFDELDDGVALGRFNEGGEIFFEAFSTRFFGATYSLK